MLHDGQLSLDKLLKLSRVKVAGSFSQMVCGSFPKKATPISTPKYHNPCYREHPKNNPLFWDTPPCLFGGGPFGDGMLGWGLRLRVWCLGGVQWKHATYNLNTPTCSMKLRLDCPIRITTPCLLN